MVRSSRRHAGAATTTQPSVTPEAPEDHTSVENADEVSPGREPHLDDGLHINDIEQEPDVPSEMAQEVWDALKEDFYEQIEQLPLSLHRSFALIGEQDKEVEACRAELLPIIRSYVKLRQSLHPNTRSNAAGGLHGDVPTPPVPASDFGKTDRTTQLEDHGGSTNADVVMEDISSPVLNATNSNVESFNAKTQPFGQQSQSVSARTPGVRETDASVPKSVPFPPRPKPKTTRELLTRIAFLMREVIRASEEKVGLATAAYDSVDRHVRVLDSAIIEHETTEALELREGERPVGLSELDATVPTLNSIIDDDDDEPQLGMIGPSGNPGKNSFGLRRGNKKDQRDKRINVSPGNSDLRVSFLSHVGSSDLPIDPHEPRYCYCHQVSFGEMIACDNLECSREWFHLGCAGLSAPPKGKVKWYCRECEELLGANKKRRLR